MKCTPALVFNHFATGFAKKSRVLVTADRSSSSSLYWHNWKSFSAGEDAFFSRFNAIGVGDGVGGWQGQDNANAGLFSRKLMHYCSLELDLVQPSERPKNIQPPNKFVHGIPTNALIKSGPISRHVGHDYSTTGIFPQSILKKAYERTLTDAGKEGFVGSTTACLAILTNGDELRCANVGDCGLAIIREGEYVFRSEEQQHSFNFPFQLGTSDTGDKPDVSQQYSFRVAHGDILVLASDGLFDNVFDDELLDLVRLHSGWTPTSWPPGSNPLGVSVSANRSGIFGSVAGAIEWMSRSVRAAAGLDPGLTSMDVPNPTVPPAPFVKQIPAFPAVTTPTSATHPETELTPPTTDDDSLHRLLMPVVVRSKRAAIHAASRANPQLMAEAIALRAKDAAEDPRCTSPFQSRAMREGLYYQGGKNDDIAVVVAIVRDPARLMRNPRHSSSPMGNIGGMT